MAFNAGRRRRPLSVIALVVGLVLLGLAGIVGGVGFLVDPTGGYWQLSTDMLIGLPVDDFILPGLFLLTMMGLVPLFIAYGLWRRPEWRRIRILGHWVPRPSSVWTGAVVISLILLMWLGLEFLVFGDMAFIPIDIAMLILGIVMLGLAFVPSTRQYFLETRGRRRRRAR
jgi:hypothetical protein